MRYIVDESLCVHELAGMGVWALGITSGHIQILNPFRAHVAFVYDGALEEPLFQLVSVDDDGSFMPISDFDAEDDTSDTTIYVAKSKKDLFEMDGIAEIRHRMTSDAMRGLRMREMDMGAMFDNLYVPI